MAVAVLRKTQPTRRSKLTAVVAVVAGSASKNLLLMVMPLAEEIGPLMVAMAVAVAVAVDVEVEAKKPAHSKSIEQAQTPSL
mmetsp:Transcript_2164/g.5843  ORF Transcript_2164/g.5843 Transcript_2164/m.5843 type:complete len:82 (+) Transcript_2164:1058-1303(+)